MGAGEEHTPMKSSKSASSAQEVPSTPTPPAYPDWSSSMQALYGAGATPPFIASTVASPPPHPFLWGSQHPQMPLYGTPVPYPALYPPGGVYAHPNMVMTPGNVHRTAEPEGEATEMWQVHASSKAIMGTSGNHILNGGKTGDGGKKASGSGNDIGTKSVESGSEGSLDASDDDKQEYSVTKKGSCDQTLANGANPPNSAIRPNFQTSFHSNPVVSAPATNLNIGMDLWNASPAGSGSRKSRRSPSDVSPVVAASGVMNNQRIQDERELKRQRRKLSNRESARRSRLRKQAECEELQRGVETLSNENSALREELHRLSEECQKLISENNSMKRELTEKHGPDILSKIEVSNLAAAAKHVQFGGDHGN